MAVATLQGGNGAGAASPAHPIWNRIAAFFAAIGRAVAASRDFDQRQSEIARLSALSDGQLADLGIARDRIVHHVFRDFLSV